MLAQVALTACGLLAGCVDTHAPPDAYDRRRDVRWIFDTAGPLPVPGIEGSTRLVDLHASQWLLLCEWRSSIRPLPSDDYRCDDEGNVCPPETERFCGPYQNWRTEFCAVGPDSEPSYFAERPTCTSTVAQWLACARAQAEAVCYSLIPEAACQPAYCPESP